MSMPPRHPSAHDVTHGLEMARLNDINPKQREIVVTLLARVAERSYRRGVQQGAHIAQERPGELHRNLEAWRYGMSTDKSPSPDSNHVQSAIDRLKTENTNLRPLVEGSPYQD